MTAKSLYPTVRPTLNLDFAKAKVLDPRITFTRASSATYVGSNREIKTASTNVPRFDYNPTTGESLGLLVEEARTNSITNNTMVGAVAGTPGTLPTGWPFQFSNNGLAVSIVGTGTESGIAYLDWRISGTATAAATGDICFGRGSALTAQTWTTSSYLKLVSGGLSGVTGATLSLIEETALNVFVTGALYSISLPTTASLITQRPTASRTLTGGATVALLGTNLTFNVSSGSTVDFTIRIGLPQLEQGAFATSAIATSTAAATRAADVASITGTAFSSWYNQTEGTVFASATTNARHGGSNSFPRILSVSDGTNSNQMETYYRVLSSYTDAGYLITSAGASQAQFDTNDNRNGQSIAFGYASNNFPLVINGTVVATDTSGTVPTVSRLGLGVRGDGGTLLNGTIKRLTYWPVRLPNATLQAITTP